MGEGEREQKSLNSPNFQRLSWSKADPSPAHRAPPPPHCLKISRGYFWKIWQHNTHKLFCNQQAMITRCILFSTLTTKAKGMSEGASNQSPELKNFTAQGPRPLFKKFLDPPMMVAYLWPLYMQGKLCQRDTMLIYDLIMLHVNIIGCMLRHVTTI